MTIRIIMEHEDYSEGNHWERKGKRSGYRAVKRIKVYYIYICI
jgi:hypothetical protein